MEFKNEAPGAGGAQFKGVKERTSMKLLKTETLKSGVVVLYYQPQKT
jgi:hypothetical protein